MEKGANKDVCVSCAKIIANDPSAIKIKCPNCDSLSVRCKGCRSRGTPYVCKKCGFEGP